MTTTSVTIIVLSFLIITTILSIIILTNENNKPSETFGALQSLYSNDGIQDSYLTIPDDRGYFDPYKYWRGIAFDLPTRNLDEIYFYPYNYEYNIDRYSKLYPYW
jgi:hypothetical protein